MRSAQFTAAALAACLLHAPLAADPLPGPPASLQVERAGALFSVTARDAPLADLLRELARQGGFALALQAALDTRVTLQFGGLPLEQALARALRGHSFILLDGEPAPGSAAPRNVLRVFAQAPTSRSLGSGDADPRARLRTIAARDAGPADAALTGALYDPHTAVREEAASALGETGDAAAVDALQRTLADPQTRVREAAVAALTDIGGDAAANALAAALQDADASLREQAVYALADIGGPAARRLLRGALNDPEHAVREAAAEALAELAGD